MDLRLVLVIDMDSVGRCLSAKASTHLHFLIKNTYIPSWGISRKKLDSFTDDDNAMEVSMQLQSSALIAYTEGN